MKGKKIFITLLILSIAVAFIGGCSSPIGGLLADSGSTLDFIRAEPSRFVYNSEQDDPFKPSAHVEVWGVFGGKEKLIAIKDVNIIVRAYKFASEGEEDIVLNDSQKEEGIQLDSGVKHIVIRYSGKETGYNIEVTEKAKGDGDNDGPSITIHWEWPDD